MASCGRDLLYHVEPSIIPHDLFCASSRIEVTGTDVHGAPISLGTIGRRFVRKRNPHEIGECLVYTDGSCYNNGGIDAIGECTIAYEPDRGMPKYFNQDRSFMEIGRNVVYALPKWTLDTGSYNVRYAHPTSNRAKLYAAILALEHPWADEGWETIVVAGDLEYVVAGITEWVWRWRENDWRRSNGQRVANIDLWEMLLDRIQGLENQGISVKFWKVPRVKDA